MYLFFTFPEMPIKNLKKKKMATSSSTDCDTQFKSTHTRNMHRPTE